MRSKKILTSQFMRKIGNNAILKFLNKLSDQSSSSVEVRALLRYN